MIKSQLSSGDPEWLDLEIQYLQPYNIMPAVWRAVIHFPFSALALALLFCALLTAVIQTMVYY